MNLPCLRILVAAAGLTLSARLAHAGQLVRNGSFETPNVTTGPKAARTSMSCPPEFTSFGNDVLGVLTNGRSTGDAKSNGGAQFTTITGGDGFQVLVLGANHTGIYQDLGPILPATAYTMKVGLAFPDDQGLDLGSNLTQYTLVLLATEPKTGADVPDARFETVITPPLSTGGSGFAYFTSKMSAVEAAPYVGKNLRVIVYTSTDNTAGAAMIDHLTVDSAPEALPPPRHR